MSNGKEGIRIASPRKPGVSEMFRNTLSLFSNLPRTKVFDRKGWETIELAKEKKQRNLLTEPVRGGNDDNGEKDTKDVCTGH